jgi:hypothetical protein
MGFGSERSFPPAAGCPTWKAAAACAQSMGLWLAALEDGFEEGGGAAGWVVGDLFGGALGDEVAAFGAGFGADVDEVVGFGKDVGVVLDDDDGVAFVDEAME